MPAPAVYVIAVLGTVAACYAFKEYVYDPHIAPKVTQWRHDFAARREANRRRGTPVTAPPTANNDTDIGAEGASESDGGNSHGYEMETLIPTQARARSSSSKEGIESWRTGIHSAISATSLRNRNNGSKSSRSANARPATSTPTLIEQTRPTQEPAQLVSIQTEYETGAEMNTHILTDDDTESMSVSSTSSVRQVLSEASIISSFDLTAPGTPAPTISIASTTNDTVTNFPQHDAHRLSSLSSLGSLQNLGRVSTPIDAGNSSIDHGNVHANINPFVDPIASTMPSFHASSPLNTFIYPSHPSYQTTHPNMWSSIPESDSSPSLIPSLSLSHPIPRADVEDGVVLLSPPSSDTYSSYSAPTSRAISPAVSEAFTSLSGISGVSGASAASGLSQPEWASSSASVESLSEFSDFSVLENASDSRSGSRVASPFLSPHSSPRPPQQGMQMQGSIGRRASFANQLGGGRSSAENNAGRYLSRDEIQHLIDSHSTRGNREA
ncbi:hypothetical protein J3R30DRAFT_3484494 [Lentinula aciculospora]|uniref:Uncharacterized protein n=1 Tax=Lentinula aciculospora TaxID=153920 RepID=A0A9W9A925_9AGAR|nr:hypothetical protein J3R30DRAFT_3484494 [Lentinula aciculospora]